jgi:hypothetical protein
LGKPDTATTSNEETTSGVISLLIVAVLIYRGYGAKVMPAQVILKAMAPLLETKDANARGKVKEIVVSRPGILVMARDGGQGVQSSPHMQK